MILMQRINSLNHREQNLRIGREGSVVQNERSHGLRFARNLATRFKLTPSGEHTKGLVNIIRERGCWDGKSELGGDSSFAFIPCLDLVALFGL